MKALEMSEVQYTIVASMASRISELDAALLKAQGHGYKAEGEKHNRNRTIDIMMRYILSGILPQADGEGKA